MKKLFALLVLLVLISGCVQQEAGTVKILNAKLEAGSLVLSLEANQSLERVRVELVDEGGQVLCTRYRDLVGGVTEFELRECEIRKKVTVSVNPPGGAMTTRDFQFELPGVRIKDSRFESGNIIVTLDADEATNNVRIDVLDETDQILCTKYKDLVKGATEIGLTDCEVRGRITVSVSPPEAEMITRDFTLTLPEVRITGVKSELGKLRLTLDANMDMSDARIHVFGKEGDVLCTKTESLAKGLTELELSGCSLQKEITVSVSVPEGKTNARDFTLDLPLLELKSGLRYKYAVTPSSGPSGEVYLYATEETDEEWKGILGSKVEEQYGEKKAQLFRFKIDKNNLNLLISYPLGKDEILEEDVQYITIDQSSSSDVGVVVFPLFMLMFKEMGVNLDELIEKGFTEVQDGGPANVSLGETIIRENFLAYEVIFSQKRSVAVPAGSPPQYEVVENKFFMSVAKPYLLIDTSGPDIPGYMLEKVESRAFDLSEYDGYEVEVKELQLLQSLCEPDGTGNVVMKNTGSKPIYTADIAVVQVEPDGAGVSAAWDKEVIQPGEVVTFRDSCEGTGERQCVYQITSPRGTVIHTGMHCAQ